MPRRGVEERVGLVLDEGAPAGAVEETAIGEVKADGQFNVVWKTPGLVPGDAWSKELEGSKDLVADWVTLKCGNYNTKTNKCGGQGS